MSPSVIHEPKVIETNLNFYLDPEKGGHDKYVLQTASAFRRKFDVQPAQVEDIKGREDDFDLDTNGFQFAELPTACKNLRDNDTLRKEAYPEIEKFLKETYGCSRTWLFSHLIRNGNRDEAVKKVQTDPALADDMAVFDIVVPAAFVHVDQSENGAIQVLQDNVKPPELAQQLRKTRWSLVNVWRPINNANKDPVAFSDWQTVDSKDLVPLPAYMPPKKSGLHYGEVTDGWGFETMYYRHNPKTKFYYRDEMDSDKILLFKCWDSINDGKTAKQCPHSAFVNPETAGMAPRESVEVRCLLFWEDQPLEG